MTNMLSMLGDISRICEVHGIHGIEDVPFSKNSSRICLEDKELVNIMREVYFAGARSEVERQKEDSNG